MNSGASIASDKVGDSAKPRSRAASLLARGSAWTLFGYGASQVLRLAGNMVLWRLLFAEAFGVMAIVNVLMVGLGMFSDVGIAQSIIQNERGEDPDYLNTVWTIQVVRGLVIGVAATLASIPFARFYHTPLLAPLVPFVALSAVMSGFNSTRLFSAARKVQLGRVTLIDLAAQTSGLLCMIIWAYVNRSVWALAAGAVVTNSTRLLLSHTYLPGVRNRFRWEQKTVKAVSHFGRWIFISTLLTFLVMQSDRLIFGKLVSLEMLGVYSIAMIWSGFPALLLGKMFSSVVFPLLSRLYNQHVELGPDFRKMRGPMLIATGWMTACLIGGGPSLIRFLYDKRALEAGWIIQVSSLGAWFSALELTNGTAFLAFAKPKWIAAGSSAKLLGMAALIPIGFFSFGFPGAVFAFAGSEVLKYAVSLYAATRLRLGSAGQDAFLSGVLVLSSVAGLVTRHAATAARLPAFFEGSIICLVVSAIWIATYSAYRARTRRHAAAFDQSSAVRLET